MNDDKTRAKMVGEMMMGGATKAPDVTIFTMTVVLDGNTVLRFLYSHFENCLADYKALVAGPSESLLCGVKDDYGTFATIKRPMVRAVSVADLSKQSDGECELAMVQALKQADLGRRARADARLQGSPIMIPQQQRQN